MTRVLGFLSLFLILLFAIANSYCQCASEMCEKTSLSLNTNTKHNYSLDGYVVEIISFRNWQECFNGCLNNCQCLSFNFNEVNTTENCELNDANTKLTPEALKEKEGVIYYEPVRTYYDKNTDDDDDDGVKNVPKFFLIRTLEKNKLIAGNKF
ncbi:hypothetical protein OS493_002113 [Desmophyllum pertusum]|uniref:Apple domain-containing protein n=1 Tax=Desmophyllum pertusum TaxID=174260 RepID=A0A9W9Z573_9CNID|nr:hypothetical protein OS493_002113 [Desmophyllum pertusum]